MHRATGLYERRRYQLALDEFIAAFLEAPLPRLHLHIARCQDKLGRPAEALRAYERLLRSDPNLSPELRSEAFEARERLRQRASEKPLYRNGRFWAGLLGGMAAVGLAVGLGVGLGASSDNR
jgi:tetratricopeptide (TPR) repeat protein